MSRDEQNIELRAHICHFQTSCNSCLKPTLKDAFIIFPFISSCGLTRQYAYRVGLSLYHNIALKDILTLQRVQICLVREITRPLRFSHSVPLLNHCIDSLSDISASYSLGDMPVPSPEKEEGCAWG